MTSVTKAQWKKDNVGLNGGCLLHVVKGAGSMTRSGMVLLRGDTDTQVRSTSVTDKSWTVKGLMQVKQAPVCWKDQGRFPRTVHR